jgi:N-acetylneuraminic acid mutarotase
MKKMAFSLFLLSIGFVSMAQELTYSSLPNMPVSSSFTAATSNDTALFYIVKEFTKDTSFIYNYSFATSQWYKLTAIPKRTRFGQNSTFEAVDSFLYVIGGEGDTRSIWNSLRVVEIYHTRSNTWTTGSSLPYPFSQGGAERIGKDIWVLCGWKDGYNNSIENRIFCYNTDSSKWITSPSRSPKLISAAGITSRNDKIYVINGCNSSYSNYNSVYELSLRTIVHLENAKQAPTMSLFPNPTTGSFTLSFGTETKQEVLTNIYSMEGKLVHSDKVKDVGRAVVNLSGKPGGFYLVRVLADGSNYESTISME